MRKLFLIIPLSLLLKICAAQPRITYFGEPDMDEMKMTVYEKDRNASAVKLLTYQETEFFFENTTIRVKTEKRERIKIFNKEGYRYASIKIPYMSRNKAKITDITAYIYYLDPSGKIITQKIEKKQIFKDINKGGLSLIAFTFPDLRPGCVIEYRYEKTEKNIASIEPWYFQGPIPTLFAMHRTLIPDQLSVEQKIVGDTTIKNVKEYQSSGKWMRTLSATYVPAFKMEPFMSSVNDNRQRADFFVHPREFFLDNGTVETKWKFISLILYHASFFGEQFKTNLPGSDSLLDSTKKMKTLQEKVDFIYREIKKKIRWDNEQSFIPDDISEVWKNGIGNSAEINLCLYVLLRKAAIPCHPILISTRDNGKPDQLFPNLNQFNGVDVMVEDSGGVYILDATQKYQSFKTPPLNILNRQAFVVDTSGSSKWVSIIDDRALVRNTQFVQAKFTDDGSMKGKATSSFFDLGKVQQMEEKQKKSEEDKEAFYEGAEAIQLKIDTAWEENAEIEGKPLIHHFDFTYTPSNTENFYFINPFFLTSFQKNPFLDSLRLSSVDFGSNQELSTTIYLEVPAGYSVEHLPPNKVLRMADSSILFKVSFDRDDKLILFRHTFQVNRSIFDKEEYPALQEFFKKIYGIVDEKVILKKNHK
jgi:hypothetical protein